MQHEGLGGLQLVSTPRRWPRSKGQPATSRQPCQSSPFVVRSTWHPWLRLALRGGYGSARCCPNANVPGPPSDCRQCWSDSAKSLKSPVGIEHCCAQRNDSLYCCVTVGNADKSAGFNVLLQVSSHVADVSAWGGNCFLLVCVFRRWWGKYDSPRYLNRCLTAVRASTVPVLALCSGPSPQGFRGVRKDGTCAKPGQHFFGRHDGYLGVGGVRMVGDAHCMPAACWYGVVALEYFAEWCRVKAGC